MCYVVVSLSKIRKACTAAQNLLTLLHDGTMADAFARQQGHAAHLSVTGFDVMNDTATALLNEIKEVSPFLRYRVEILGQYDTAARLRDLVMNLFGGRPANLSLLFMNADEHHTRIALECIARYTRYGENDAHFMSLSRDIFENFMEHEQEEVTQ